MYPRRRPLLSPGPFLQLYPLPFPLSGGWRFSADADVIGKTEGWTNQRRADPLFRRVYDVIQAGDLGNLTLSVVTMPYYRLQTYYDQPDWRGTWALNGGSRFSSPTRDLWHRRRHSDRGRDHWLVGVGRAYENE
jgi:hypothetical protein